MLAGERGTEGMQAPAPFSNPALYNDYYTYNFHVPADLRTSLKIDMKHPERTLQRTGKDLKMCIRDRLDTLLPLYKKWGLKGIKFGFVQIGNQRWSTWLRCV